MGNRLTGITNHKNESFAFNYDTANRLKSIIRPGSKTTLGLDQNGFLSTIDHNKTNNTAISQFTYSRDALGNRTGVSSSFGSKNYTYDSKNQLKTASNSEASTDYLNEVFDYDNLGNRVNSQLGGSTYDPKKRRLMEDYKHVYSYDFNGNMTIQQEKGLSGNFKNFTYSSENQLIKVEEYQNNNRIKTSEYFFDAVGRRMKKLITDHSDSTKSFERNYVYDQQEILAEHDESKVLGIYTHSMLRTDDVLAVDVKDTKLATNIQSYFYLKNAIGTITEVVDSSGSLIQHYVYSSFGKILKIQDASLADITSSPALKTSYGFTNREHDDETGLMYYRARFMIPEIGRFMQEDPHPGKASMPKTLINKYVYAANNPLRYADPTGEFIFTGIALIASYALATTTYSVAVTIFVSALAATATGAAFAEINASSNGKLGELYHDSDFWEGVGISFAANLASFGVLNYFGMIGSYAGTTGFFKITGSALKAGATYGAVNSTLQAGYYVTRGKLKLGEAAAIIGYSTVGGALTFGMQKRFFPKAYFLPVLSIGAGEGALYFNYLSEEDGESK